MAEVDTSRDGAVLTITLNRPDVLNALNSEMNRGLAAALKDAAITALVTFALFLPLIGFKTVQNMRNELELETRFPLLLVMVALIAAARLFGSLVIAPLESSFSFCCTAVGVAAGTARPRKPLMTKPG